MSDEIQVTLVANAGILLSFRGRKLLIDGLFRAEDTPFSCIPAKTLEKLLNGYPPYDDIDYLLFTHYHTDHFSPEITRSYLEAARRKGCPPPARAWRGFAPSARRIGGAADSLSHRRDLRCL